jgi:proline iminopeptidase
MRVTVNDTDLFVDIDGSELAVRDGRLERRPTLIALHGGPGFDQGYLRLGLGPLREDCQVVFVDLRGQGRSGRPPIETCTIEQMADDIADLCEILGLTRPIIFGHSFGGFVALDIAVRHPDLAAGLILCDSAPTLAPIEDDQPPPGLAERGGEEAVAAAGRLFGGDMTQEATEAFARLVFPRYAARGHEDIPNRLIALSGFEASLAGYFFSHLAPRYDLRGSLPSIRIPALVIHGTEDWVMPPAGGRSIAEGIAGARLVPVHGAGHFPFSEEPESFLEPVRAFIAGTA